MKRAFESTAVCLAVLWLGCAAAPADPGATVPLAQLRGDLDEVLIGFVLFTAGLAALALSLVRHRRGELYLVSIGAALALFGGRLVGETSTFALVSGASPLFIRHAEAVITYVIPIPFLIFAEQFLGPGYRSSIRRLWQFHCLYAAAGIAIDGLTGRPGTVMAANGPLVIVEMLTLIAHAFAGRSRIRRGTWPLRLGFFIVMLTVLHENLRGLFSWRTSFEPVGILVFFVLLTYASARRLFTRERELAALEGELETARRIQSSILPAALPEVRGLAVGVGYLPAAAVAGDLYDFVEPGGDRLGILVADVCGHGVPAALIASMVKVAFSSQAAHAAEPERVLLGMNATLCGKLGREFVTAAYLLVDAAEGILHAASAGHPPPLLQRRSTGELRELSTGGPILGRFPDARFTGSAIDLEPGDRLVLFTDGGVESTDAAGEPFGEDRLRRFLAERAYLSPRRLAEELLAYLETWTGKRSGSPFDDDLTLVVVDFGG